MLIDNWIKQKIGLNEADTLTRKKIREYQLFMLNQTLTYAKSNSTFYKKHLPHTLQKAPIQTPDDIETLPFTTPAMLYEHGREMVCVPASSISRIVSLDTSGTTDYPKRVFFTEEDQELTIDYFHHGMRVMVRPDDTFLILLPGKTPGSVGDLLRRGLERDGINVISFGYPNPDGTGDEEVIRTIINEGVNSLVGSPETIARIAAKSEGKVTAMKTVLLTSEYVPQHHIDTVKKSWNCGVFEHYGMTETGLGGAMACVAHEGYHPREADLLYEIINPQTGECLPEGQWGELVFSTLTRVGMPLIRYRTGDMTRWIPGSCPCGSVLKRFERISNRNVDKKYG